MIHSLFEFTENTMDKATLTRLHGISELLEKLKPLLQENISRLEKEILEQEPLIQRLLDSEIITQKELITQIQESAQYLKNLLDPAPPPPNPKGPLTVVMRNGEVISETKGIDTLLKVIDKLGIERVKALNIIAVRSRDLPLISDYEDSGYDQKRLGRYYIASGNNTPQKKQLLEEIDRRLNVGMKVTVKPKQRK